ncbi:MAG: MarR family transcriptional regulator [Firmicutes bacterium]|nr:MarR family transcriptional regulator [[Eubacterium] siraeum]MCM1488730.1 MarR family transcriptional regulator [Bacillota bacterium]
MNIIEKDPISLMAEVMRMYNHILKDEMRHRDYRIAYHHLLKPLYEKDNVTQLDLVKSSDLKAPTVSYSLQQMEGEGLIYREADKKDARSTRVHLTEEGREIEEQIQILERNICGDFLKGISKEKQEEIAELLSEIYINARRALEQPKTRRKYALKTK